MNNQRENKLVMNQHGKKMVAPIVIVAIIICYYLAGGFVFLHLQLPVFIRITIVAVSVAVTVLLLSVLIGRIREIQKGEEDDLGKY